MFSCSRLVATRSDVTVREFVLIYDCVICDCNSVSLLIWRLIGDRNNDIQEISQLFALLCEIWSFHGGEDVDGGLLQGLKMKAVQVTPVIRGGRVTENRRVYWKRVKRKTYNNRHFDVKLH
jgi:hypothetical protein